MLALDRIGAVTVSHADLAVGGLDARGRQTAPVFQVTGLGATIRPIDPGASDWTKAVEVEANLGGAKVVTPLLTVPVQILSGEFLLHHGQGKATFALRLDTLRATGSVSLAGANPALAAFSLAIPELDVNRLQRLMNPGQRIESPGGTGPRRLLARGRIDMEKVVGFPITATVHARGVNLEEFLRVFRRSGAKITGALDADLRLTTALSRDPRAALSGQGTFFVRGLVVAPLEASRASGQVRLRASTIEATSYAQSAYG